VVRCGKELPPKFGSGDSIVMVSDGGGVREPLAGFLYVYVEDADAVYRMAINAGAVSIEAPADMPYGDRRATGAIFGRSRPYSGS